MLQTLREHVINKYFYCFWHFGGACLALQRSSRWCLCSVLRMHQFDADIVFISEKDLIYRYTATWSTGATRLLARLYILIYRFAVPPLLYDIIHEAHTFCYLGTLWFGGNILSARLFWPFSLCEGPRPLPANKRTVVKGKGKKTFTVPKEDQCRIRKLNHLWWLFCS